ncbi:FixH family protein [Niallia taxi]|uniref:FixH family protein n=1 Tax=Niallia taxi TaxID=2499688 RepID=UPI003D2A2104
MKKKSIRLAVITCISTIFLFGCTKMEEHEQTSGSEQEAHEHSSDVTIEIVTPINEPAAKELDIEVALLNGEDALTDAKVGFETWKEGDTTHPYFDAVESDNGHYQSQLLFEEPGEYTVKVHVEKGSIHEHKEIYFTVGE